MDSGPLWEQTSSCSLGAGLDSLPPLILPISSTLMAEHRTPVSPPLPKPLSTWVHFLSLTHLSISFYHQASTIHSFPEWGLFSPLFTFQPIFLKYLLDQKVTQTWSGFCLWQKGS